MKKAKKVYSFRLSEGVMTQAQKMADKENRTVTNFIETLLIRYKHMKNLLQKLSEGPVYLYDDFEGAVFKVNGEATMVKYKGKTEYPVHTSVPLVYDAMMDGKEITEKEYNDH